MHSSDARILRGAAIPTGLAGIAAIAASLALAGTKGALGAAIGAFVVIAFFSISVIAVSYAAKISPQMMFAAAVFSYIAKIFVMFALVAGLDGVTVWDSKAFGWSVIALTLVWIGAEILTSTRAKTLYVDPEPAAGDLPHDPSQATAGSVSTAGSAADRGP
jgi:ATP synthase protein I